MCFFFWYNTSQVNFKAHMEKETNKESSIPLKKNNEEGLDILSIKICH